MTDISCVAITRLNYIDWIICLDFQAKNNCAARRISQTERHLFIDHFRNLSAILNDGPATVMARVVRELSIGI